jgi:hypothetical protein
MTQTWKFEIGQRVTNENGTWVELTIHQHPSNFYHVYGYRWFDPTCPADIMPAEGTTNMSRARIERAMVSTLKNR